MNISIANAALKKMGILEAPANTESIKVIMHVTPKRKGKKPLIAENIQPKAYTRYGKTYQSENKEAWNAEIVPGEYIRIYGEYGNHINGPQRVNKTFRIGDIAEHGSYNLIYTGKIVKIGPKTITITNFNDGTGKRIRLDLYTFYWRNWNYDAEKIARENADTMMVI